MDSIIVKAGDQAAGKGDGTPSAPVSPEGIVGNKPSFADDTEVDLGDGKKITFKELKSGYSRQDDYTRKTQELAEQRKALESDKGILDWLKDPEIPASDKIKALAEEWNVPFEVAEKAVEGLEDGSIDPTTAKEFKTLRSEMQAMRKELAARDGASSEKEVSQELAQAWGKYPDATEKEKQRILDIAGSPMNTRNRVSIVTIADEYFGDLKERDASTIKNYLEGKTKDKDKTPPPLSGGAPAGEGGKKLSLDDGSAKRSFVQRMKETLSESSGA